MPKVTILRLSVFAALAGMVIAGCDGSTTPVKKTKTTPTEQTERIYSGAGSDWTVALHANGSCELNESISHANIQCLYTSTSSGFLKLNVTSANKSSEVKAGDTIYGLELENYVFVAQSIGKDESMIPMVKPQCPSKDGVSNYIHVYLRAPADLVKQRMLPMKNKMTLFGQYNYTVNGSAVKVSGKAYSMNGTQHNDFGGKKEMQCSKGKIRTTINSGKKQKSQSYYFSANNMMILKEGNKDGYSKMFGIPQDDSVKIDKLPSSYLGMLEQQNLENESVHSEFTIAAEYSNNVFTLYKIDPVSGSKGSDIATIRIKDPHGDDVAGSYESTVTINGQQNDAVCMFDTKANQSKTFVACSGFDPIKSTGLLSLVLIEK
jgi:hypothetical protein